jgi:hypothetical protein
MDGHLRVIHLGTHDETALTHRGQHTGLTDLPLTPQGEGNAPGLRTRFADLTFAQVFTSRLHRLRPRTRIRPKRRSCLRAAYEGLRSEDIRFKRSDWRLFRDGLPGRRIASPGKSSGRLCAARCARCRKRRAALFERTLHAPVGRPLDGSATISTQHVISVEHSEVESGRIWRPHERVELEIHQQSFSKRKNTYGHKKCDGTSEEDGISEYFDAS